MINNEYSGFARQRLGVNIDHVATIRNARGGDHPDPVRAALTAEKAGADGITLHLREDRRHIRDEDLDRMMGAVSLPVNLEMACTEEMLEIALAHKPQAVCLVPEKRTEVTTEGVLDVIVRHNIEQPMVNQLADAGIRVSIFIDPDRAQLDMARRVGAPVVELHTGAYCDAEAGPDSQRELDRLVAAAVHAETLGFECHAGHGLTFDTVGPIAAIPNVVELNIGHFLVSEAVFSGLDSAIRRMRSLMDRARATESGSATA